MRDSRVLAVDLGGTRLRAGIAIGATTLAHLFAPEVIVLGGGVGLTGPLLGASGVDPVVRRGAQWGGGWGCRPTRRARYRRRTSR
jgi:hypothetical protein